MKLTTMTQVTVLIVPVALDLLESRVDSKGVTIPVYRPAGRPQYR